jgi:hypothetical protein
VFVPEQMLQLYPVERLSKKKSRLHPLIYFVYPCRTMITQDNLSSSVNWDLVLSKAFISIGSLSCFCYSLHDQAMLIVLSRSK